MNYKEAWRIITDLASGNFIDEKDAKVDGTEEELEEQNEAWDVMEEIRKLVFEKPKTDDQMINKMSLIFPDAIMGQDNEGQLIIYTNYKQVKARGKIGDGGIKVKSMG